MSWRDSEPKSTSVPSWVQFSATGSEKSRLAAISGSLRANSSWSSMNSIDANSGFCDQRLATLRLR